MAGQAQVHIFGKAVLFLSGCVCISLSTAIPVSLSVMFLCWQDSFNATRAKTAAVHATCLGLLYAGGVIPGYMSGRFGVRITVLLGSFLSSLGLMLGFYATSIEYLIVTTGVLAGFGFCLSQVPCIPCVLFHFTKYRSVIISAMSVCQGLANIAMPILFGELIHSFGWRGAYLIISGIAMNTSVFGILMTSSLPPSKLSLAASTSSLAVNKLTESCGVEKPPTETQYSEENGIQENKNGQEEALLRNNQTTIQHKQTSPVYKIFDDLHSTDIDKDSRIHAVSNAKRSPREPCRVVNKESILSRLQRSQWRFLVDRMTILFNLNIVFGLAIYFSFLTLIMDYSKTALGGDESQGLFLILIYVTFGLFGRLISGPINLVPHCHSILIMSVSSCLAGVAMVVLGSVKEELSAVITMACLGVSFGGLIGIYPKVLLDMRSIDSQSYSIALGFTCTVEGIADLFYPIAIGYCVDQKQSYFLPLTGLGIVGIIFALLFIVGWINDNRTATATATTE